MSHYIMVARLSNRCFSIVLQIPNRLNTKVTQGDFMALYNKSEEEQFKLLSDVLEGHISFQELKRRKREKGAPSIQKAATGNIEELQEEVSRLKSQNTDLRIKLEQAVEDLDNERKRANKLERRLKVLEKESEEEFSQYRRDVDSLRDETYELAKGWVNKNCVLHKDEESDVSSAARISSPEDKESTDNEGAIISSDEDVPLSSLARTKHTIEVDGVFEKTRKSSRAVSSSSKSSDPDEESPSRTETALERLKAASTKGSNEKIKHKTSRLTKPICSSKTKSAIEDDDVLQKTRKSLSAVSSSSESSDPDEERLSRPETALERLRAAATKESKEKIKHKTSRLTKPICSSTDYSITVLMEKEWVAVAYEEDFFVGQIEKKLANKVRVTFLEERRDEFFSWPKRKDRADIKPAFIFCRNLEVLREKNGYIVNHLPELRQKFQGFSSKYFSQNS
ncbi:M protein, serotype 6-like isoform X2 [Montipora capricornis]|uniref:M protein, serotype 6-like isoform X2 n=1 Tax=Montipora capricornis TaxID=246305 RepID=UPI0035F1E7F2